LLSQIVQSNRRYQDLKIKEDVRRTIRERRNDILSRINLWLITRATSCTKQIIRKEEEEGMTMMFIKRIVLYPKDVINVYDLGYLGVETDFPEQLSALPFKKKRNSELSQEEEEKEYNKIHSRKRIVIEHTICRLKKYRIQSDIFRNRLRKYDKVSDIVAGPVNYRIMNQCL
jgi:hypothetical protein